jgi:hypothetical protein
VRKTLILLSSFLLQQAYGSDYVLNESALHTDTRDFSLGGLICDYESASNNELILTCLIPFQLYDLSVRKIAFNRNAFDLEWNVDWYQSGNEDWMENNISVHVGKKLSNQFYLGANACLLMVDNAEAGLAGVLFAELDSHFRFNEKFVLGVRMVNISGSHIKSANETISLSSSAHLGAAFFPTTKSRIYTEMDGQLKQPLRIRVGLEYNLFESFVLRTGFNTEPLMPSWGIGGNIHRFKYSWGGNLHPILGFSNGFTLAFHW